jgi:hypothetical protein
MSRLQRTLDPRTFAIAALFVALAVAIPAQAQRNRDQYPWQDMQQHAFDVADGGTLQVRVNDADVAVMTSSGGNATVDIRLRSNDMEWATDRFARTNYRARLDGGTVIVESDRDPRNSWVSGKWMSVFVEVHVPARFDLDVMTQDGDVAVGSFEGDARLRSQDGDIIVDRLTGGDIELRTQDGDVRAATLDGGRVNAHSQDGDIEIDTLHGTVAMSTQDGDIRIGTATASQVELSSHDGDISLAITSDARLELETADGDISIEAPAALRADIDLAGEDVYVRGDFSLQGNVSEGRARGTINGGGERIRARTHDGAVRLLVSGAH